MENNKTWSTTMVLSLILTLVVGIFIGILIGINKKNTTKEVEMPVVTTPVTNGNTTAMQPKPSTTTGGQPQPIPPVVASTTYTYKAHGFTMELPKGFVPNEMESEGGPSVSISLPNNSAMSYVTNASFWEQYTIAGYQFVKNETIGTTTFKVYTYGGHTMYWFKQGNVGYEFSGDANLLKTFKFVGWAQ